MALLFHSFVEEDDQRMPGNEIRRKKCRHRVSGTAGRRWGGGTR